MSDAHSLDPDVFGADHLCFGCSQKHPAGFRLKFTREGDEIVTRFTPGAQWEGPPGIMHGGLQATLADEIGAWTVVGLRGRMGFTGSMNVRLLRPIRIEREVLGRGRITRDAARLFTVEVKLHQDGETAVVGEFVFAVPDAASAEKLLGRELPDEWRKLCRQPGDRGRF